MHQQVLLELQVPLQIASKEHQLLVKLPNKSLHKEV
jgi:hypothetical protein